MIPTVKVVGGWESVLVGVAWSELEREALPRFLQAQRWFGGKGRRIENIRLVDWCDFDTGTIPTCLTILEVFFAEGVSEWYSLLLAMTQEESATQQWSEQNSYVIARLKSAEGETLLHDALADNGTCDKLLETIAEKREFTMRKGLVRAFSTASFANLRGDANEALPVKRGPATSSNSLLLYGERLLLKLFRKLERGINPDYEVGRFLTENGHFTRIPRVAGAIEYYRPDAEPFTLAILQSCVPNDGDGWRHVLDALTPFYRQATEYGAIPESDATGERSLVELAESNPSPKVKATLGGYAGFAATLGRRTAELHQALASKTKNPDFASEPFVTADLDALRKSIGEQCQSALTALRANLSKLPPEVAESAQRLLNDELSTLERLPSATPSRVDAVKIRCHGDYHLGQVLRVGDDFFILDFEGEPLRTIRERRAKQSPLKDVAGMLRSYHYAAYAGLFAFARDRAHAIERLESWAEWWFRSISAAFLRAYLTAARDSAFVPRERSQLAALLDAFMLEKAFYELNYELNNRPDWVRIPLHGIMNLLGESAERGTVEPMKGTAS